MSKEHAQSFVERFFEDDEFVKEVTSSHSYDEALCVMMDWFDIC